MRTSSFRKYFSVLHSLANATHARASWSAMRRSHGEPTSLHTTARNTATGTWVLLQLDFQALKQRQRIGRGTCKPSNDAVAKPANLVTAATSECEGAQL